MSGASIIAIKRELEAKGIKTPTGKDTWPKRTIETILSNEKYAGDVLIYKTYCAEYPDKRRIKNQGQHERLFIRDNHPPIISKEQFEMVQLEKNRRTNVVVEDDGTTE
jgi:site-specific DNA recombinase